MKFDTKNNNKRLLILISLISLLFFFTPKVSLHNDYSIYTLDIDKCVSSNIKISKTDLNFIEDYNLLKYQLIKKLLNLSFEKNSIKTVNIHLGTHLNIKNPLLLVSKNKNTFDNLLNQIC